MDGPDNVKNQRFQRIYLDLQSHSGCLDEDWGYKALESSNNKV